MPIPKDRLDDRLLMSTTSTNPITKALQYQWILLHIVSYGVAIGILTFTFTSDEQNLQFWLTMWALLYIFVGIFWLQWLLIRRVSSDIRGWGSSGVLAFLVSLLTVAVHPVVQLFVYIIVLNLRQYWTLKHLVKRAFLWLIISPILWFGSIFLSGIISIALKIALDEITSLPPTVFGVIGGLIFGALQGFLSIYILQFLFQNPEPTLHPEKEKTESSPIISTPAKPKSQPIAFIALQFIVLITTLVIWASYLPEHNNARTLEMLLVFGIVSFPYVYFCILVHELGHLCAALGCGFRLRFIAVSRLALVQNTQGLQFKLFKKYSGAGGITSTIPKNDQHLRHKLILKIASGPLASFLLFCLGVIALQFPNAVSQNPLLWVLTFMSVFNLAIAVLNLIPFNLGSFRTDGGIIWMLLRKTPDGLCFQSLYTYNAQLMQGIRPRAVKAEIVERALGASDRSPYQIGGFIIAYEAALDAGQIEQAGDYLDQALARKVLLPDFSRTLLLLEGAYFYAYIRRNLEVAQDWFAAAQDFSLVEPYTLARAKAALALVEENYPQALEQAQQGIEHAQAVEFMPGSAIAELDLLRQLETDAKQGLATTVI